jgi:hypothetical protein
MKLFIFKFTLMIACCSADLAAQGSRPRLIPIAEGWAKNQVNAVIFRKNSVTSFNGNQYAAFYNGDSKVVLAKRKLGETKWQLHETQFSGNTADAHNSISLAVDGKGFLHLAWNSHGTPLQYSCGIKPESLEMPETSTMIGNGENKATYPEFYTLPNGDLLFFYRDGASGNGNLVLNRFDVKTRRWTRLQDNLIDGENSRNAYSQITVDAKGTIHISWVWRESPNVATNHDLCYAKSSDGGRTWAKSSGEKYVLPIPALSAEYVWRIPQNSELINQTSMAIDASGRPYIATYWRAAGSMIPQYQLVYFDGRSWRSSQISNRTTAFSLSGAGTKRIPISRPQIVVDSASGEAKVFVVFRDIERNNRVSVAICDDLKKNLWRLKDLTQTDVGMWEPMFDQNLWDQRKELHLFVQKVGQGDGEGLEQFPPQMISILEWKP